MHSHTLARTLNRHECLAGLYQLEICHLRNKTTCLSDVYLHLTPPTHIHKNTHKNFQSSTLDSVLPELLFWHFHYFSFLFFVGSRVVGRSAGQVVQLLLGQRGQEPLIGLRRLCNTFYELHKHQERHGKVTVHSRLLEKSRLDPWKRYLILVCMYSARTGGAAKSLSSLNWRPSCSLLPWLWVFSGAAPHHMLGRF